MSYLALGSPGKARISRLFQAFPGSSPPVPVLSCLPFQFCHTLRHLGTDGGAFCGFRSKNVISSGSRPRFSPVAPFGAFSEKGATSYEICLSPIFSRPPPESRGRRGLPIPKMSYLPNFVPDLSRFTPKSGLFPPSSVRETPQISPEISRNGRRSAAFPDNFGICTPISFQNCHTFPRFPADLGTSCGRNWIPILSSLRFAGQNPERYRTILDSASVRHVSQPCPGRIPDPSGQEGGFRSISVPVFFRILPARIPETATTCSAPRREGRGFGLRKSAFSKPPRSKTCHFSSLFPAGGFWSLRLQSPGSSLQ